MLGDFKVAVTSSPVKKMAMPKLAVLGISMVAFKLLGDPLGWDIIDLTPQRIDSIGQIRNGWYLMVWRGLFPFAPVNKMAKPNLVILGYSWLLLGFKGTPWADWWGDLPPQRHHGIGQIREGLHLMVWRGLIPSSPETKMAKQNLVLGIFLVHLRAPLWDDLWVMHPPKS